MQRSIFRRLFNVVDHQKFIWTATGLELQSELLLDSAEDGRPIGGFITRAVLNRREADMNVEAAGEPGSRALVVSDARAWDRLVDSDQALVLIPVFQDADVAQVAQAAGQGPPVSIGKQRI